MTSAHNFHFQWTLRPVQWTSWLADNTECLVRVRKQECSWLTDSLLTQFVDSTDTGKVNDKALARARKEAP